MSSREHSALAPTRDSMLQQARTESDDISNEMKVIQIHMVSKQQMLIFI